MQAFPPYAEEQLNFQLVFNRVTSLAGCMAGVWWLRVDGLAVDVFGQAEQ